MLIKKIGKVFNIIMKKSVCITIMFSMLNYETHLFTRVYLFAFVHLLPQGIWDRIVSYPWRNDFATTQTIKDVRRK